MKWRQFLHRPMIIRFKYKVTIILEYLLGNKYKHFHVVGGGAKPTYKILFNEENNPEFKIGLCVCIYTVCFNNLLTIVKIPFRNYNILLWQTVCYLRRNFTAAVETDKVLLDWSASRYEIILWMYFSYRVNNGRAVDHRKFRQARLCDHVCWDWPSGAHWLTQNRSLQAKNSRWFAI